MARLDVYIPKDLKQEMDKLTVNWSKVCQEAIRFVIAIEQQKLAHMRQSSRTRGI